MRSVNSQLLIWAFRSLLRSQRVRLATGIALVFHLGSILTLIRRDGKGVVAPFVYLSGFIPIAILATVTQGNLFGTDRGSTITALTAPVHTKTFCRLRIAASMLWTLAVLT